VFALVILVVVVIGVFWSVTRYRERPPKPAAYEVLFNRLLKKLSKRGLKKDPAEDTRAFLVRVTAKDIPQSEQLASIVELYNRIKYGHKSNSEAALGHLRSMVKAIRI
jgi:hypothetical protein